MKIALGWAAALLIAAGACADPPPTPQPSPPADPRIAVADEVLTPPWRKGTTWTLEIHGKVQRDGWFPFWTTARYEVLSVGEPRAKVRVDLDPIVRPPSKRASTVGASERVETELDRARRRFGDGRCQSMLEFWLPWRLVQADVDEFGETLDLRRAVPTNFSLASPPRAGTSPCVPLVPRHPTLQPSSVAVPKGPQSIEVTSEGVRFMIYDDVHTRITWIKGQPWWALMENVASSRKEPATPDERRPDQLQVFRGRLIAIDGRAIEPLPWSSDENWLRDNWPSGGIPERDLPAARGIYGPGAVAP